MDETTGTALRVFFTWLGVAALGWALFALVRAARRGGKGFRSFGAALMLFGWGHMRDPRNDTVAEANDGRASRGSDAGDGARD
ncbi:MAG TPA: hypothetical protein VFL16_09990 [Steroidobacteraceae bacterium]|nr:hypothetical protein [Steroidobacteraceae bacterium]